MGEESHLDEMRSAIRGDFERLAERRGEQELMRVEDERLQQAVAREPQPVEVEIALQLQPEPEPQEEPPEPPEETRSWFARFVSP